MRPSAPCNIRGSSKPTQFCFPSVECVVPWTESGTHGWSPEIKILAPGWCPKHQVSDGMPLFVLIALQIQGAPSNISTESSIFCSIHSSCIWPARYQRSKVRLSTVSTWCISNAMALWFLLLSQSCQPPIFTISAISKQKISAKLTRFHCRNYSSGLTTLFLPSSLTFISLQHPFLFPSITQNYTSLYQDYNTPTHALLSKQYTCATLA